MKISDSFRCLMSCLALSCRLLSVMSTLLSQRRKVIQSLLKKSANNEGLRAKAMQQAEKDARFVVVRNVVSCRVMSFHVVSCRVV